MSDQERNIITLFGGTFDPVHSAHLYVAESVYKALPCQEIRFLPCYIPVHREKPQATAQQRLEMLHLALEPFDYLSIDEHEIKREGSSYMIDTLQQIRGEENDKPLALLISTDQFKVFDQWKEWQRIFNFAHIIVVNRPGYSFHVNDNLQSEFAKRNTTNIADLNNHRCGFIFQLYIPPTEIAATDIRHEFEKGSIPKANLPANVYDYILQHKLYI